MVAELVCKKISKEVPAEASILNGLIAIFLPAPMTVIRNALLGVQSRS